MVGGTRIEPQSVGRDARTVARACDAWVTAGKVWLLDAHDAGRAQRALRRAVAAAVGTQWEDDARFWLARALTETKNLREAADQYRALIDAHASSWFVGDYRSLYHDDSLLALGVVLEDSGRVAEAVAAYRELLDDAPTSRLCDDAAFRLAQLAPKGRRQEALRRFLRAYPNSRHAPLARRWLQQR